MFRRGRPAHYWGNGMRTPTVKLFLRIRLNGIQKYVKPVFSQNHSLRPFWAWVNGVPEHHPEARYVLRYRGSNGRRAWETIGQDSGVALAAKLRKEKELAARQSASEAGLTVVGNSVKERVLICDAIAEYLSDCQAHRARKTFAGRKRTLDIFMQSCNKTYLDQIERRDLLDYMTFLKNRGLAAHTIFNRAEALNIFLRANGITGLITRGDMPRYTEKVVAAYDEDELKRLFDAADDDERLAFEFFLQTGAREQEVQFAAWRDVSFKNKTFSVTAKPDLGFTPKDYEERPVPLPDKLIAALQVRRRLHPDERLIFSNGQGGPEGHFLRKLKKLALRARLNCGHCVNKRGLSCKAHPVCGEWELHKFRKTYATMHHEAGVSARTLQAWLGHSDLETTLAYLQVADMRSKRTREQVNHSFASFA